MNTSGEFSFILALEKSLLGSRSVLADGDENVYNILYIHLQHVNLKLPLGINWTLI